MTFPILGGNGAVAGYSIDNSLRYNNNDSPELSRTPSSASNKKTFTFSTWLKRGELSSHSGGASSLLVAGVSTNILNFRFQDSGILNCILSKSGSTANGFAVDTDAVFRDVSAFYHVMLIVDTTQASITDAVKIYVNNTLQSFSSSSYGGGQNVETPINDALIHSIGYNTIDNNQAFDGYLAETYLIDGQALSPTDFGEFDEDSGIWKPISYSGSYGTNGFYLDFENSGSLGADQSGNGNNFSPTNLASTDQITDTPTNNFATFNPLVRSNNITFSEGNTKIVGDASANFSGSLGTISSTSGKWYCEMKVTDASFLQIGALIPTTSDIGDATADGSGGVYYHYENIYWQDNNSVIKVVNSSGTVTNASVSGGSNSVSTYTTNDIIMMALDLDNGLIWFGKNGTWENSGVPASGTNGFVLPTNYANGMTFYASLDSATAEANFGNPSFSISSGNSDDNGYGNFEYAPPSGYLALCTQNLATELSPTIDDGSAYFHTQLYTGDGTTNRSITNDANAGDFQPDFLWIKERSSTSGPRVFDSNRGAGKRLVPSDTGAESSGDETTSFDSDGFTIGGTTSGTGPVNENTQTYVAWQWKANGGTTSSNTDGSITSTVQANTTAGFSIVTYTGTGSLATIGHGLGKTPKMIIWKRRDSATNWSVQGTQSGINTDQTELNLNSTNAVSGVDSRLSRQSQWSSTTFEVNTYVDQNASGGTYVAYCFAETEGYSKFGSYTGNSNTDGPMINLSFRPSFFMCKNSTTGGVGYHWYMFDSTRDTYNVISNNLMADQSDAETTYSQPIDFLSNGVKIRSSGVGVNGGTMIYMAFAENPFVSSSGVPVVAR